MDRRRFIGVAAGGILAAPRTADPQPAGPVRRIGWLDLGPPEGIPEIKAFRLGLSQLGWSEGRNIVIVVRGAEGKQERLPDLAAELVELRVDVIVTISTRAAVAAKNATSLIPIVTAGSSDPVAIGLVQSLSRPGGNVTGLTHNPGAGFPPKLVQLLREAAPRVSRIAVLWGGSTIADEARMMTEIQAAAPALAIVVLSAEAREPNEIAGALAAIVRLRPDGLFAIPSIQNSYGHSLIADFALANRLPSISGLRDFVLAGGLLSYWIDWTELRRHAATYVDKILRGAKPGELPVEQPSKFELVINLKTAKTLGLTIPQSLILRADEVIQ